MAIQWLYLAANGCKTYLNLNLNLNLEVALSHAVANTTWSCRFGHAAAARHFPPIGWYCCKVRGTARTRPNMDISADTLLVRCVNGKRAAGLRAPLSTGTATATGARSRPQGALGTHASGHHIAWILVDRWVLYVT
jgi:hypothetical protein